MKIETLEGAAALVKIEADRLLARARETPADELGAIARQFTRAQAYLVHPHDHRYQDAQRVMGYCDEADAEAAAEAAAAV